MCVVALHFVQCDVTSKWRAAILPQLCQPCSAQPRRFTVSGAISHQFGRRIPAMQLLYSKRMQSIGTHHPIAEKDSFRFLNSTHCSDEF